jgi:hypothetical protein
MLGIYESSIKKMSFETGLNKDEIKKALDVFENKNKVKYVDNYVILCNYMKHQNFNTNMKKSAIDTYNSLPNSLKDSSLNIDRDNPSEGFERLLNHYGMVRKIEVEYEVEEEDESNTPPEDLSIDFKALLTHLNKIRKSKLPSSTGFTVISDDVKKKYKATLKKGYNKNQIRWAIQNAFENKFFKEEGRDYRHLTPEYFSRPKTLDQYGFKPKHKEEAEMTEYEKMQAHVERVKLREKNA